MEYIEVALQQLHDVPVLVTEKSENQLSCRLKISSTEEWNTWLDNFSNVSHTSWNVSHTFPNPKRYVFRKRYQCHHHRGNKKMTEGAWKIDTRYVMYKAII